MSTKELEKEFETEKKDSQEKTTMTADEAAALLAAMAKGTKDKKAANAIEYTYVFHEIDDNRFYHWDFRKQAGLLYKWDGGHWKHQTEDDEKDAISSWLRANHKDRYTAKTVASIYQMLMHTVKPLPKKKLAENIIPTRKHWLLVDEKTGEITAIPPDKSKPITYQIDLVVEKPGKFELPSMADLEKKSTYFFNFINSSLENADKRALVQEFCGYSMTGSVRKQVFQMWIGNGANGKSVLIKLLKMFHGAPVSVNISKVHEYNSHLMNASLIFCTETSKNGFDQEFVKQAVSGDTVEIREIYGKKQNTELVAKWIMLMNAMPHINDFSDGLFRRAQIISWDKQFLEGDPNLIEDLDRLIIENEKDIFLFWCLHGLVKMIKNDWKFTKCAEVEKDVSAWKNSADKVRLFVSEFNYQYIDDEKERTTNYTSKKKIFEFFNNWADENNFENMNSTTFWLRMSNIFPKIKTDPEKKVGNDRVVFIKAKPL